MLPKALKKCTSTIIGKSAMTAILTFASFSKLSTVTLSFPNTGWYSSGAGVGERTFCWAFDSKQRWLSLWTVCLQGNITNAFRPLNWASSTLYVNFAKLISYLKWQLQLLRIYIVFLYPSCRPPRNHWSSLRSRMLISTWSVEIWWSYSNFFEILCGVYF